MRHTCVEELYSRLGSSAAPCVLSSQPLPFRGMAAALRPSALPRGNSQDIPESWARHSDPLTEPIKETPVIFHLPMDRQLMIILRWLLSIEWITFWPILLSHFHCTLNSICHVRSSVLSDPLTQFSRAAALAPLPHFCLWCFVVQFIGGNKDLLELVSCPRG